MYDGISFFYHIDSSFILPHFDCIPIWDLIHFPKKVRPLKIYEALLKKLASLGSGDERMMAQNRSRCTVADGDKIEAMHRTPVYVAH